MTTINSEDQDEKKDKVSETEVPKATIPEPVLEVKEGDKKKDEEDDDDDDGGGRDVPPLSAKKR